MEREDNFDKIARLARRACNCELAGYSAKSLDNTIERLALGENIKIVQMSTEPFSETAYCISDGTECVVRSYTFQWSKNPRERRLCDQKDMHKLEAAIETKMQTGISDDEFQQAIVIARKKILQSSEAERTKISAKDCR